LSQIRFAASLAEASKRKDAGRFCVECFIRKNLVSTIVWPVADFRNPKMPLLGPFGSQIGPENFAAAGL
jgi:hypothetical protein